MNISIADTKHEASTAPGISVIIPVLHEAALINSLVESIRHVAKCGMRNSECGVEVEIIVSDGSPDADTLAVLGDPSVVRVKSRKGRAAQMNSGAAAARGRALLFLHADTRLPEGAFQEILSVLRDERIVGGAFDLGINSDRAIFRITELYVYLRTRLSRVPFGDQAIFLRSDYFRNRNGFKEVPIMEDIELMKRIKRRGDRIRIVPRKVMTSPRRWEREGLVRSLFRNWSLQILYLFGVRPERLAKYYRDEAV